MSFVARRLGSAGLVVTRGDESQGASAPFFDRNAERESGITLKEAAPVVLAIGVDDEVAGLCSTAAREADIKFVRVAHGVAACREILASRPTVVAISARLWADERVMVADIARSVGAKVLELPHVAPATWQALIVIRTAIGLEGAAELQAVG